MRRFANARRSLALVAAMLAALVATGAAAADRVRHDDDDDVLVIAAGGSASVTWRITDNPRDGICDPALAPATVAISVSGDGVTADPSTLVFTACDSPQSVTFTVSPTATPGDRAVTASVTSGGSYASSGLTIRVTEAPPSDPPPPPLDDTTAPVLLLPSPVTAEATSPSGATVTYTATATDDVDGTVTADCAPPSGSVFPLGTTTVNCTATDAAGNPANGSFTVTVADTTPPTLTVPADITVPAASASGAVVTYSATATDTVSAATVQCSHPPGSTFPVGATTVTCTARDAANNTTTRSFAIVVTNSPPVVNVPPTQVVEAASATGSNVAFVPLPSASDPEDGPLNPICTHASGARFPLGTTTVTCTATDRHGEAGTNSFLVVVRDTTPPVVTPPQNISVSSDAGEITPATEQVRRFLAGATAADLVGVVSLTHNAPAVFPIGRTVVTFVATDASGNTGDASATVEVLAAGRPVPPPPPPAAAPPENVVGLRARSMDSAVRLEWRAGARATRYVVARTDRNGAGATVYDGRALSFVDRRLVNGMEYRYVVVSYDAAGTRSVGVAISAVPDRPVLVTPAHGAGVTTPPSLKWRAAAGATYYNVQLFRVTGGAAQPIAQKILSVWPVKPSFRLQRSWRFERRTMRLSPGTYEWYVWAGYGPRSAQDYSPLLGWSRFVVRAATKR